MLFFLSKLVNTALNPLLWIIIIQFFVHIVKEKNLKKRLLTINIILLLFFSNGHFIGIFIRMWEYNVRPVKSIDRAYDYGVLPGGFSNYFPKNERLQFNCSSDRIMQTLDLYKKGIIKKIIIAGGSGRVFNKDEKESVFVKAFLLDLDIPEEDIFIEEDSRNTYENARNVSAQYGNDSCNYLLVTSAMHMRRALPCYKKLGLNTDPYPVNFVFGPEKERGNFWNGLMPSASNISSWSMLLKEWIGTIAYKIRGYH